MCVCVCVHVVCVCVVLCVCMCVYMCTCMCMCMCMCMCVCHYCRCVFMIVFVCVCACVSTICVCVSTICVCVSTICVCVSTICVCVCFNLCVCPVKKLHTTWFSVLQFQGYNCSTVNLLQRCLDLCTKVYYWDLRNWRGILISEVEKKCTIGTSETGEVSLLRRVL